jgi:hypothetical protein
MLRVLREELDKSVLCHAVCHAMCHISGYCIHLHLSLAWTQLFFLQAIIFPLWSYILPPQMALSQTLQWQLLAQSAIPETWLCLHLQINCTPLSCTQLVSLDTRTNTRQEIYCAFVSHRILRTCFLVWMLICQPWTWQLPGNCIRGAQEHTECRALRNPNGSQCFLSIGLSPSLSLSTNSVKGLDPNIEFFLTFKRRTFEHAVALAGRSLFKCPLLLCQFLLERFH